MNDKFVSIIVPTYRDWKRLGLCVDSLANQTYPADKVEVIIVNNDPKDPTPPSLVLPSNMRLITEAKPGSYAARNTALKMVKGEIIGLTDSDCIADKNWISNAVRHFEDNPSCDRIAGHIFVFPKTGHATLAEKYDAMFAFRQKRYVTKWGTCVTGNLFARKKVFDQVGLFNESKMSFGDVEWGSRAEKQGFVIHYAENVLINHPARDLADLIKKEKRCSGGRETVLVNKHSKLYIFMKFLNEARPKVRGEIKLINSLGRQLPPADRAGLLLLRWRLMYVRASENMKIRMGKKPNRE